MEKKQVCFWPGLYKITLPFRIPIYFLSSFLETTFVTPYLFVLVSVFVFVFYFCLFFLEGVHICLATEKLMKHQIQVVFYLSTRQDQEMYISYCLVYGLLWANKLTPKGTHLQFASTRKRGAVTYMYFGGQNVTYTVWIIILKLKIFQQTISK